jgi:putative ABC transport system permease protein
MDVIRNTKSMSFVRKENRFSVKRVMVTLQFCISIVLAGSTLIAYQQFRYLNEKNLGIEQDQIIAIPGVPDKIKDNFPAFKEHLKTLPGIAGVAACMEVPSREIRDSGPVLVKGVNDDPASAPVLDVQIIDHDFVDLLGIEFLAGKNIPQRLAGSRIPEFTADFTLQDYLLNQQRAYLINETAMHQLGWQSPQEAIGQEINWSIGNLVLASGPITGVVKDFHQESLRNKVDPIVMVYEPVWIRTFLIKVETQRIKESLEQIQAAWDTMFPLYPLEYHFLDDLYQNLYMGERVQLQLLCIFSGLAIFIAFTGLIGMIAYALKTRVKEIAIRKVLGASVTDLIRMIGKEYLTVLLIGGVLAVPLSYYGVKQWLSNFAYRVDISPASYLLTLAVIAFLLLGTIGLQTFRTSRINPADTLRDE